MGATCWMPALFTSISILPSAASVSATSRAISSALVISACAKRAPASSDAAACPLSLSISASVTLTPCSAKSRAIASPIPDAAPVTSATLPVSSCIEHLLLYFIQHLIDQGDHLAYHSERSEESARGESEFFAALRMTGGKLTRGAQLTPM